MKGILLENSHCHVYIVLIFIMSVCRYVILHKIFLKWFRKSMFKHIFVHSIPQETSFHFDSTIAKLYSSLGRYELTLCSYIVGISFYFKVGKEKCRLLTALNFINES